MKDSILNRLGVGEILISDGAWGTQLQAHGLQTGECPELWNLTKPEQVSLVAQSYIEAGADIILTNTFGASPFKLSQYGCDNRTAEINRQGVALSRQAAGDDHYVLASVGPTGQFVEPLGDVTETDMQAAFQKQIAAQAEGGADAILIETMADLKEAELAVRAAKRVCSLPVCVTMTFEAGQQGYRTMMGVSIEQAVTKLINIGVDIIGTNCGNGIEQMIEIIRTMRSFTNTSLIAHPNAGMPRLENGQTVFDQSPEDFAAHVPTLIDAGAQIVGGCCGTTPEHIRTIAETVHRMKN